MRYREATPIQRFLRWSAATTPVSWVYVRVLHHLDQLSYRLTRGRHTFSSWLSGLPVVMLTTTGAKTGQQRTLPVIAVPDGDNLVVIASNWGQRQHPAWYYNLCAHPEATVTVGSVSRRGRAHEATGEQRDRLWQRDLEVYPGRSAYERRAANRPRGTLGAASARQVRRRRRWWRLATTSWWSRRRSAASREVGWSPP